MAYKAKYGQTKEEHAFQTFHKELAGGTFPPVMLMYGEEEYLIEWACRSLAEKFTDEAMRNMDFVKLCGEECTVDGIIEACDTFSVFSERRIVWARDFGPLVKKTVGGFGENEKQKLSAYMENPNDRAILIFSCVKPDDGGSLAKLLKKQCKCYNFASLDRPQLTAFAEKRFKAAGTGISKADLRYFIDETGYFNRESEYRIYNLENDIKKVTAYSEGGVVTREDVDQTLHGDMDRFAFNFLDAISSGNKGEAFRLLHNMLGGGSEVFSLLGLLINQFELMYEVKELEADGMTLEAIAKRLKVNGYRVRKAAAAADKLAYKKLRETLSSLYEVDRNIKTGTMDGTLSLEMLIGRM